MRPISSSRAVRRRPRAAIGRGAVRRAGVPPYAAPPYPAPGSRAAVLLISRAEVEALLDADALVDALATAMADLSAGRASVPPRVAAEVPERYGLVLAMPGHVPSVGALAVKVVSLFPGNAGTPVPTHQAVVVVCDPATGTPVAFMDGTALTERRTAAGSALATRLLARADARVLAVLGTGVQARAHALALPRRARAARDPRRRS